MKSLLVIYWIFFSLPALEFNKTPNENECLKKTSSEWGSNCAACYNSTNSYRVNLKNICDAPIDIKVAVQEKTARWRTFNLNNMAPGDSISAYACNGTGKYIFWSRKAGDKTVTFPTDEEIAIEYPAAK
jgi:hypothetical protein